VGYLQPGDQIVAVDGRRNLDPDQISAQIASHTCAAKPVADCRGKTAVRLLVQRGQQQRSFAIHPRYDPVLKRMRIGFSIASVIRPVGPLTAAGASVSEMWSVTRDTVVTIAKLFEPKERKQLHGVVGGFKVTQQRFAFDTTEALYTLAIISLSLAVINLFPFLPLDGGHVFWAVAEKVRGRRIRFEVMERAGAVGFALIMIVFVIGLSNDISTLTGPGFNVH
jgi:regulator of sigma E protease